MLDGAITMGSADAAHIQWITPQEWFEKYRLPQEIRDRLKPKADWQKWKNNLPALIAENVE